MKGLRYWLYCRLFGHCSKVEHTSNEPCEACAGRGVVNVVPVLEEAADQFVYLVQLCEEREKMILWMSDAYGILAATGHGISLRQRADDLLGTDGRPWR